MKTLKRLAQQGEEFRIEVFQPNTAGARIGVALVFAGFIGERHGFAMQAVNVAAPFASEKNTKLSPNAYLGAVHQLRTSMIKTYGMAA